MPNNPRPWKESKLIKPIGPSKISNSSINVDDLDVRNAILDAGEITLSFDTEKTHQVLDKLNKNSLVVLQEHLKELILHVEKRLFEKS